MRSRLHWSPLGKGTGKGALTFGILNHVTVWYSIRKIKKALKREEKEHIGLESTGAWPHARSHTLGAISPVGLRTRPACLVCRCLQNLLAPSDDSQKGAEYLRALRLPGHGWSWWFRFALGKFFKK